MGGRKTFGLGWVVSRVVCPKRVRTKMEATRAGDWSKQPGVWTLIANNHFVLIYLTGTLHFHRRFIIKRLSFAIL